MAKKYNNQIQAGSGMHLTGEYPIDDRTVVQTFTDLEESDTSLVKTNCAYEGMQVYVLDDKKTYEYKNTGTTDTPKLEWKALSYEHNHYYAGSSSQGGAANNVKNALTIKLNSGTTENTDMFTFDGSVAKTVNITSPGTNQGIEVNGNNEFILNKAFYDYLLKQTFKTPTINSLTLIGNNVSGSHEVGTEVQVTKIAHYETNIDNITGNLMLSRGTGAGVAARTVSNSIAKASSSTNVEVSDSFTATSNGTVTYTLSAPYTDTTNANKTATKTASVSFYWPVFYGATSSDTPSNQTGLTKAASFDSNMLSIPTTATNKHLHFLSAGTIKLYNSLKLPITPGATGAVSITVNGQAKTYNYATIQNCGAGTQKIYVNI